MKTLSFMLLLATLSMAEILEINQPVKGTYLSVEVNKCGICDFTFTYIDPSKSSQTPLF